MRARLALQAKGLKYELIEEDLREKSKLLLESNPVHKKIPVLLHNGKAVAESLIIVLYVDETWPEDEIRPGFMPKDPYGRATTHFWTAYIDKKIFDLFFRSRYLSGEPKDALVKELYENFITRENGFAKLGANPFLHGNDIGYADIALAPLAAWLPVFVELVGIKFPTVEEAPHLHNFFSAISEHPAVKLVFPEHKKLLSFARVRVQQ